MAKAIGIQEALSWLKVSGLQNVQVEIDSLLLASSLKRPSADSPYFQLIIDDYKTLLVDLNSVHVNFVRRSANQAAHMLAKATGFSTGMQRWGRVSPLFLLPNLLSDIALMSQYI